MVNLVGFHSFCCAIYLLQVVSYFSICIRYPYEAIRVITSDGYVLLVERIPRYDCVFVCVCFFLQSKCQRV